MGRPTKFTPETREKVLIALRGGNYRETAANFADISYTTLRNWLVIAEDPSSPPEYHEFLSAVRKAEADAEITDIARIRKAGQEGNWQASAWVQERKNPGRWGKKDKSEIALTGADGGPLDVNVTMGIDVAAISTLASILANRHAEQLDPVSHPGVLDTTGAENELEGHRIVPGELAAEWPSLAKKGSSEPVEDVVEAPEPPAAPIDDDVAEYEDRMAEQKAFEEITAPLSEDPDLAWWQEDEPEDDSDGDQPWWQD